MGADRTTAGGTRVSADRARQPERAHSRCRDGGNSGRQFRLVVASRGGSWTQAPASFHSLIVRVARIDSTVAAAGVPHPTDLGLPPAAPWMLARQAAKTRPGRSRAPRTSSLAA